MASEQQQLWEQIFGFRNPLQRPRDRINPIEDGKEFRKTWFDLSTRIIGVLKSRLASTYDSSIPSAVYDSLLRGWAEEIARSWIESDRAREDRLLESTRGQYLFQKWGFILHINSTSFPKEKQTTEIYRTFLLNLLSTYLGGAKKDIITSGLQSLAMMPVVLGELVRQPSLDISFQFMFDVTVHVTDLDKIQDYPSLLGDITYVLQVVRPAHTLFSVRVVLDEAVNLTAGCVTQMGSGYLLISSIQRQPVKDRTFVGLYERSLEGVISELDVTGQMKVDGLLVRFDPATVVVTLEGGFPSSLSVLKNGDVVLTEGWPVNLPLSEDGFLLNEKTTPTAICDLDKAVYRERNYDDIRKCFCPLAKETHKVEHFSASLTSYGTVILTTPHTPLSRGGNIALPPIVKPDGSGGIRVWYMQPDQPAVNVTGKIKNLYPREGLVEILAEPGIPSPEEAAKRYLIEYYFFSPEIWVDREVIVPSSQVWPHLWLKHGPLVGGDGTAVLFHAPQGDLKLAVNGIDQTHRIKNIDVLRAQLELYSDFPIGEDDLVEVSYWYWQGLTIPLLTNMDGRVLNDMAGETAHRFVYNTVLLDNRLQSNPSGSSEVLQYSCPAPPKVEVRYCALDRRFSALLNDSVTLRLNEFGGLLSQHKLNRYSRFCTPAYLKSGTPEPPYEYIGPKPHDSNTDPTLEDPARRRLILAPDIPPGIDSKQWYEFLTFYNRQVVEGNCFPRPCDEGLAITFRMADDSYGGVFEDPEMIHLNDWGQTGYYLIGFKQQRCCYMDYGRTAAFNVLASRLNQLNTDLNSECQELLIPLFALIYNARTLWRRSLNSKEVVIWSVKKKGMTVKLADFQQEQFALPTDTKAQVNVGILDRESFGPYQDGLMSINLA